MNSIPDRSINKVDINSASLDAQEAPPTAASFMGRMVEKVGDQDAEKIARMVDHVFNELTQSLDSINSKSAVKLTFSEYEELISKLLLEKFQQEVGQGEKLVSELPLEKIQEELQLLGLGQRSELLTHLIGEFSKLSEEIKGKDPKDIQRREIESFISISSNILQIKPTMEEFNSVLNMTLETMGTAFNKCRQRENTATLNSYWQESIDRHSANIGKLNKNENALMKCSKGV